MGSMLEVHVPYSCHRLGGLLNLLRFLRSERRPQRRFRLPLSDGRQSTSRIMIVGEGRRSERYGGKYIVCLRNPTIDSESRNV